MPLSLNIVSIVFLYSPTLLHQILRLSQCHREPLRPSSPARNRAPNPPRSPLPLPLFAAYHCRHHVFRAYPAISPPARFHTLKRFKPSQIWLRSGIARGKLPNKLSKDAYLNTSYWTSWERISSSRTFGLIYPTCLILAAKTEY